MTTERTTTKAMPLGSAGPDRVGETTTEGRVVARKPVGTLRLWSFKTLGVLGLVAATTLLAPDCANSGSDSPSGGYTQNAAADGVVTPLSPSTIEALRKDTGVNPFYVLVFTEKGPTIIGQPPNVKITRFDNEQEIWATQGPIKVQDVKPTAFVSFQRNPNVQCFPYSSAGSIVWYCVEIPG